MVVLGLGSLEGSSTSRYQLALGLLLSREVLHLQETVQVYDPVFSAVDKRALSQLGWKVMSAYAVLWCLTLGFCPNI